MDDLLNSLITEFKKQKLFVEISMIISCFSAIMHWVLIKMINIDIREHLFLRSLPKTNIKFW